VSAGSKEDILAGLRDEMTPAFPGTCMHEALFSDEFLDGTDVTTLDFAKAMIDEGCRLSGASMSRMRMRSPWISIVSPSITLARPAMVSA
jgi:hypothetical protein